MTGVLFREALDRLCVRLNTVSCYHTNSIMYHLTTEFSINAAGYKLQNHVLREGTGGVV